MRAILPTRRLFLPILLHSLFTGMLSVAQLPQELTRALQENASALSPCQAKWSVARVGRIPLDALAGIYESSKERVEDYICLPEQANCEIDGKKIKVQFFFRKRSLQDPEGPDEFYDERTDLSFNGTHVFSQSGYGASSGITDTMFVYALEHAKEILINNYKSAETYGIETWQTNYFLKAGFVVPTSAFDFSRYDPRPLLDYLRTEESARIEYHGLNAAGGASCHTVVCATPSRKLVLYYDESLHYALRRQLEYDREERLVRATEATEFLQIPKAQGLYLPRRIKIEYYQQYGRPATPYPEVLFEEHYSLESFERVKTPAAAFELIPKVGTLVGDDRIPTADERETGLVHYTMPASIGDLDAAIQHAIDGTPFVPSELSSSSWISMRFVAINIIVILLLSIAIWYRHRHSP